MAARNWQLYLDIIFRIITFIVVFILYVLFTVLKDVVDPRIVGFFCDDNSIRYPYKNNQSVPDWSLFLLVLGTPTIVMILGSLLEIFTKKCKSGQDSNKSSRLLYKQIILKTGLWFYWFLIGIALTDIITSIVKMYFGELRPHFLAVCDPDWSLINCTNEYGYSVYVTNYTCRGAAAMVRESRLSFPSGHSSSIAFSMVFTAFYISSIDIVHRRSPVQFFLLTMYGVLFPSLVALSRIDDHRHHFRDVIFGSLLGIVLASILVFFSLEYFELWKKKAKSKEEDEEQRLQEIVKDKD